MIKLINWIDNLVVSEPSIYFLCGLIVSAVFTIFCFIYSLLGLFMILTTTVLSEIGDTEFHLWNIIAAILGCVAGSSVILLLDFVL